MVCLTRDARWTRMEPEAKSSHFPGPTTVKIYANV